MSAVLLVAEGCQGCEIAVREVGFLFAEAGLPLVVRKPTLVEQEDLPGVPALHIPKVGVSDLLLVGEDMAEALRERPELCCLNDVNGRDDGRDASGSHPE